MSEATVLTFQIAFSILFLVIIIPFLSKRKQKHQLQYIETYKFPRKINLEIKKAYPHLSDLAIHKVLKGLREYFYISRISANDEMIGMPSQVVDKAWHEFILFTKEYQEFCNKAFGKFHHHIPAEAMKSKTDAQLSIRAAWEYSCKREHIYIKAPQRLPLLFAMDSILKIEDGFHYTLNCNEDSDAYCVKNIGSTGKGGCGGCGGGCSGQVIDGGGCSGGGCGGCGG